MKHEDKDREEHITREISNLRKMIKNRKKMLITAKSKSKAKNQTAFSTDKFKLSSKNEMPFGNHIFTSLPKMNDIPDPKKDKLRL